MEKINLELFQKVYYISANTIIEDEICGIKAYPSTIGGYYVSIEISVTHRPLKFRFVMKNGSWEQDISQLSASTEKLHTNRDCAVKELKDSYMVRIERIQKEAEELIEKCNNIK